MDYYRGCSKLPGMGKDVPTCPHGKTFLGVSKKDNANKGSEISSKFHHFQENSFMHVLSKKRVEDVGTLNGQMKCIKMTKSPLCKFFLLTGDSRRFRSGTKILEQITYNDTLVNYFKTLGIKIYGNCELIKQ